MSCIVFHIHWGEVAGLGDMGMSVLSVRCGEGGLTSAWMGEGVWWWCVFLGLMGCCWLLFALVGD